jgi:hypothetical protein
VLLDVTTAPIAQDLLTDHPSLPELATKVRAACRGVHEGQCNALHSALDAGDALNAAKPLVVGRWGAWLRANCFLSVRTAQLYAQLADHRDEIEAEIERVTDLSLRAARRLIMTKRSESPSAKKATKTKKASELSIDAKLTQILHVALSNGSDGEKLAALARLSARLQSHGRTLHNAALVIASSNEIANALASAKQRRAA